MMASASGYMLGHLDESDGTQVTSDNPIGAGNQQESLSPDWVVGFVDGEGCFFVGINRQPSMKIGWQVLPEFRVVQHETGRGDSSVGYTSFSAVVRSL